MYQVVTGMMNGLRFKTLYESEKMSNFNEIVELYKKMKKNGLEENEFIQLLQYHDNCDWIEVLQEIKKINGSYKVSNWLEVVI